MLDVSKYLVSVSCRGRYPIGFVVFRPVLQSWRERNTSGKLDWGAFFGSGGIEDRVFTNQEPSNIERQLIEENKTSSFIHTDHPSSPSHPYL